jgi:hypothetical protein
MRTADLLDRSARSHRSLAGHRAVRLVLAGVLPLLLSIAACGEGDPASSGQPMEPAAARQAGGKADGAGWCHGDLTASDGLKIALDYQVQVSDLGVGPVHENVQITVASPAWLNVTRNDLDGSQAVRAVLVERWYDIECGGYCRDNYSEQGQVHTVDLTYQQGRYTAPLPDLDIEHANLGDSDPGSRSFYELAVVVNGTWSHGADGRNLRFDPGASPGFCAQGSTF